MKLTRRHVTTGLMLLPMAAGAQDEPFGKTVTLVVPFPPGGSVDAVTRQVQHGLGERLKAAMIIENKGGAAGSIGAAAVARAAPDGKTWLFVFDSHAVNPFLQKLPFDSEKDLAPVTLIGTAPNVLATPAGRSFATLADILKAAKEKPGTLSYATIGAGSIGHLTMVRLEKKFGVTFNHVPYKGGGPAISDAIAGHVDLIIGSAALINPQLVSGKLRPLVQFGARRATSAQLVNTPTIGESGAADLESYAWWGVFAPAKTPAAMIERFVTDLRATLADPKVATNLSQSQQIEIRAEGALAFQSFFAEQMRIWGGVVTANNIQAEVQ